LLAAAKAVRAAHGAVAKLTPQQRATLGLVITHPCYRPAWLATDGLSLEEEENIVVSVMETIDAWLGFRVGRGPQAVSGKQGRPGGAKAKWAMHQFVLRLWYVSRLYGGDVTLSNKGGEAKGTIVAILDILKPTLPKHFFPGILNHSFLRKVQESLPHTPAYEAALDLRRFRRRAGV
jgi:hypothetical protein